MADFKPRAGGPKRFGGAGAKPTFGARGGKPGFTKKPNWADRGDSTGGDRSTTLYKAICSKCGNECEVPFRPVNGKPVFCRNCFVKTGDTDTRGRAGDRFPKREFNSAPARFDTPKNDGAVLKQLEILNTKLDRLIGAIESMQAPKSAGAALKEGLTEAVAAATKVKKGYPKKKAE